MSINLGALSECWFKRVQSSLSPRVYFFKEEFVIYKSNICYEILPKKMVYMQEARRASWRYLTCVISFPFQSVRASAQRYNIYIVKSKRIKCIEI